MKKLLLFAFLLNNIAGICQKNKIYATVIDEDKNPIARGYFKNVTDSGIIILVDNLEIFVGATEITTLKIEKNKSKAEFLKLGTTTLSEVAENYLINSPDEETDIHESDTTSTSAKILSTETKEILFGRIKDLVDNLISGANDLATISINNSLEKYLKKIRLLQQYSMDKEIIHWNDLAENQQSQNEVAQEETNEVKNEGNGEITNTNNLDQPPSNSIKTEQSVSDKPKPIILNKGFYIVKPVSTGTKSNYSPNNSPNENQMIKPKSSIIPSTSKTSLDSKQTQTKNSKQPNISIKKDTTKNVKKLK